MFNARKWLKKLCRAHDSRERNRAIRTALRANGIRYTRMKYRKTGTENILVRFGDAWDYHHIFSAHYDKDLSTREGANDNAAACIALIQMAVNLTQQGYRGPLALVWFDAEEPCNRCTETGEKRSGSYLFGRTLAKRKVEPDLFVVLDVVGNGDTLFYSSGGNPRMAIRVREGYPTLTAKPTPGSDDYLLEDAGIPSILLCVLPAAEMSDPYPPTWQKLHTDEDNIASVKLSTISWLVDHLVTILEAQDFVDPVMVEQEANWAEFDDWELDEIKDADFNFDDWSWDSRKPIY